MNRDHAFGRAYVRAHGASRAAACGRSFSAVLSILLSVVLAITMVPAAALAASNEDGETNQTDISDTSSVGAEQDLRNGEESVEGNTQVSGDDDPVLVPAANVINQTMPLETVAQQESTRSFFLAQTLESTRTIPMVSANLPLDTGTVTEPETDGDAASEDEGGEDSDESDLPTSSIIAADSTVVGSFTHNGITYAVEPGGETVAVVAADYNQLPEAFIENQAIVIPSTATADGIDYYSVTRIADCAFAGLSVGACFSLRDGEAATEDNAQASAATSTLDSSDGASEDTSTGIAVVAIPASVTTIGDNAFTDFDTLQYIVVSDDNLVYGAYDGCLYNADLTNLLLIPGGRLGAVCVAPSVETLDPEVFSHSGITEILADADSAAYQLLEGSDLYNVKTDKVKVTASDDDLQLYAESYDEIAAAYNELFQMGNVVTAEGMMNDVSMEELRSVFAETSPTPSENPYTPLDKCLTRKDFFEAYNNPGLCYFVSDSSLYPVMWHTTHYGGWHLGQLNTGVTATWATKITTFEEGRLQRYTGNTTNSDNYGFIDDPYKCKGITSVERLIQGECQCTDMYKTINDGEVAHDGDIDESPAYLFLNGYRASALDAPVCRIVELVGNADDVDLPLQRTFVHSYKEMSPYQVNETNDDIDSTKPLATPKRPGYEFAGYWNTVSAETGTESVAGILVTASCFYASDGDGLTSSGGRVWDVSSTTQRLYAHWTPIPYTVSCDLKGGSVATANPVGYDIETADFVLTNPTKTGYSFKGWSGTELDGDENKTVTVSKGSMGNRIFTANWIPNTYPVTFDGNGGSGGQVGIDATATYDAELPKISSTKPQKSGYVFTGWFDADGVGYYDANGAAIKDKWTVAGDVALHAEWTTDVYRVDFVTQDPKGENQNHARPAEPRESIANVPYKSSLASLGGIDYVLTCMGYEFLGWSTDKDATEVDDTFLFNGKGEGLGTYETAANTVVYSIWAPRTLDVVFDPNAAGIDEVETTQTFNQNLKDVPAFHRFGYELDGWYRNEAGTGSALDTTAAFRPSQSDLDAESITYFAKWTPVTYTVTLYPGEHGSYATMFGDDEEVVADGGVAGGYVYVHSFTVADKTWPFVTPKGEGGYSFAGWEQSVDGAWTSCPSFVDADSFRTAPALAFRAKWSASEASIKLELNGAPASEQVPGFADALTYSIDKQVTLPTPVWAGHTFQGWKLIERGGVKVDPAEAIGPVVVGTVGTVPEDIVCEAAWVADTYTVRFLRSAASPTEIAPEQKVGRDDAIVFVQPSFKEAFDLDRTNNPARIFRNYRLASVSSAKFYPEGEPVTMAELLAAYPNLKDTNGKIPENGSNILFYADWNSAYSVEVPLKASIAFDPERIMEDPATALKPDTVTMRLPNKNDSDPVEIVSLICEPTATTASAFDSEKGFYDHAYLTLSAKQRSATETSTVPVELNLGAAIEKGSLSVRDVKHPTTANVLSLPEIGFAFGGSSNDDRILDLTFGIRFDSSVDPANLRFLNAPSFKNTGNTIDLANVYYTLAMKR